MARLSTFIPAGRTWKGSHRALEALPARVRDTIAAQELEAERLVARTQLIVVAAFSVLYSLSPKTFDATSFEPVPVALLAYFIFTLVRLVVVQFARTPRWLMYASVFVDMLLLFGLIFSFHVQYQQPAAFYLKAPTFLYVFIFISLRALYFETAFVLFGGLCAVLGWLAMVAYVVHADADSMVITRDYVVYLTSNSLLLGAEFDKIVTVVMVTVILALAMRRARRLLVEAVRESAKAHDLSLFVPDGVARRVERLESEVRAGQGELAEASILFSDIEGFTTVSEQLGPAELIEVLNQYFLAVCEPITRYGGVVNQFQGDAILATFNLPDGVEDHAGQAILAALEMQRVLATREFTCAGGRSVRLRARVGINSGDVVGGFVGTDRRLNYTVHGDAVNLAARLEQLNKHYGTYILVSARTKALAESASSPLPVSFQLLGTTTVRGRSGEVEVYTVAEGDEEIVVR